MRYGSREFQNRTPLPETEEDKAMNQDLFAAQWQQMRGTLKAWWGKLADDDCERIGGQTDNLIGVLQEKYGYGRAQAQQEVERRMKEYGDTTAGPDGSRIPEAAGAMASMTAKAQELGATAASKAGEAATAVGEQMGALASVIRDHAPHEGAIATAATAVAGGLESARSYLHEKEYANLATDLTALVRRYPPWASVPELDRQRAEISRRGAAAHSRLRSTP
jgi:uncharacterized protein YjbJ (UPF0337 family)